MTLEEIYLGNTIEYYVKLYPVKKTVVKFTNVRV